MPRGFTDKLKLVVSRPAGNYAEYPEIKVYKAGPFFECYVNDVMVGKVMKLTAIHGTEAMGEFSGKGLKLRDHIIALTDQEALDIEYEINLDNERRTR